MPMKLFAFSLATACTLVQAADVAAPDTATVAQRVQERSAIAQQRAAITQTQAKDEKACHQRFAVESCLQDVRNAARAELAPLRARELELNQQERQERTARRLREIDAKQAQSAPPTPLQAHTRKPGLDAPALEQIQGARASEAAARAAQQRQRQADHAQRVQAQETDAAQRRQQAEHDWQERQRRVQERQERQRKAEQEQRGQHLPVPAAGVSPPER